VSRRSRREASSCTDHRAPVKPSLLEQSPTRLRRLSCSSTDRRSWAWWRASPRTSCGQRSRRLRGTLRRSSLSTRSTPLHPTVRRSVYTFVSWTRLVGILHAHNFRKIRCTVSILGTLNRVWRHRLRIRDYTFQNSLKFTNFTEFLKFVKIRFLCITKYHKSFRVRATLTENNCLSKIHFCADVMSC